MIEERSPSTTKRQKVSSKARKKSEDTSYELGINISNSLKRSVKCFSSGCNEEIRTSIEIAKEKYSGNSVDEKTTMMS